MNPTPHECMTRWHFEKAKELVAAAKSGAPGYEMTHQHAVRIALDLFNELDNFGLIDALEQGRALLEADAKS